LDAIEQHGRDVDGVMFEHDGDSVDLSNEQSAQLQELIGTVDDIIDTYGHEERD
jgi:hypothetical protein